MYEPMDLKAEAKSYKEYLSSRNSLPTNIDNCVKEWFGEFTKHGAKPYADDEAKAFRKWARDFMDKNESLLKDLIDAANKLSLLSLLNASCEKAASLIEKGGWSAVLNLDQELQDRIAMCLTPNLLRKRIEEGAIVVSDEVKNHVQLTTSIFKDDKLFEAARNVGATPVIIGENLLSQPKDRYLCTASLDFTGDLIRELQEGRTNVDIRDYLKEHTRSKMEGEVVIRPDIPDCETITLNYTGWSGTKDHSSVSDLKRLYSPKGRTVVMFAHAPRLFIWPLTRREASCIEVPCYLAPNPYTNKHIDWLICQADDTPSLAATNEQQVRDTQHSNNSESQAGQPKIAEQQVASFVQPVEGDQANELGPLGDTQQNSESRELKTERQPDSGQPGTDQIEPEQPETEQAKSGPFDASVTKDVQ